MSSSPRSNSSPTTPTQLDATATVPAGSYCDRLTANGVEIISFSSETPDPSA
ncbi:hypothetical protein [Bacteroides acidifaciens]|uniref:hypothetical protein n=1 Tax=Bacteroides acidifaciens TaxID=85831 RepID=UPI0014427C00|nr:hypothetical protein [Bacteroides acidifaciens]